MNDKKYLTAITRTKPSVPMRYLASQGLLKGRVLDYGCGKGYDAKFYGLEGYDPHYAPRLLSMGVYDVLVANYVLNVLSESEQIEVYAQIMNLLKPAGVAYITVRRDIKQEGFTSKGTYQTNVKLNLPIVKETTSYCIYKLTKL